MKKQYFVLYTNCRLVNGVKRCLLIDYNQNIAYYISREYYQFIHYINGKEVDMIRKEMEDEESIRNFDDFIQQMVSRQLAFLTEMPELFPPISLALNDDKNGLRNAIIELDDTCFNEASFELLCHDLSELNCKDIQIRLHSPLNLCFLSLILSKLDETEALYVEIHLTYTTDVIEKQIKDFIEHWAIVSNVFVYNSPSVYKTQVVNEIEGYALISLGTIYFLNYPFDNGKCCGQIFLENLDFTGFETNNLLMQKNGCLYKKVAIDINGNIHNCPSMPQTYGNICDTRLASILHNKQFTKCWNINKDKIKVCRDCEFRYNCTDCRAFLSDPSDPCSKPAKCGYNPCKCIWQ